MTIFNPPFSQTFANKPHHKKFSRISLETLFMPKTHDMKRHTISFSDFSCRLQIVDNSSTNYIKLHVCACMEVLYHKIRMSRHDLQYILTKRMFRLTCAVPFQGFSYFYNEFTAKPKMCVKM